MKFAQEDERYLRLRREFSQKAGARELWSVIDHWPLYCGLGNMSRYLAIAGLVEQTLDVPGHVAEFGSWRGSNLMFMAKLLKLHDRMGQKQVHCFDSFSGLETFTNQDGAAATETGAYAGNFEELQDIIRLYEMQDDIRIHKGLIQDTLPKLLQEEPALTFSMVYCDTDLYEPTLIILEGLHERLAKGGLFVFDEWNDPRWPGEGLAANEFLRRYDTYYEMKAVQGARQPSMVLRKIRF